MQERDFDFITYTPADGSSYVDEEFVNSFAPKVTPHPVSTPEKLFSHLSADIDGILFVPSSDIQQVLDLVGEVTSAHPSIPCILLTSMASTDVLTLAVEKGAADVIPVGSDRLSKQDLVERCLSTAERFREGEQLHWYEKLFEIVGEPIYVLDSEGAILHANPAFEELLDTPLEELRGVHVTDIYDEESLDAGEEELHKILADPEREHATYTAMLDYRSLEPLPVDVTITPVYDEFGQSKATVASLRDITKFKQQRQQLSALHESTRRLFSQQNHDQIISTAVSDAQNHLGIEIAAFFKPSGEGKLVPVSSTDAVEPITYNPDSISLTDSPIVHAFEGGELLFDMEMGPDQSLDPFQMSVGSALIVPAEDFGVFVAASRMQNGVSAQSQQVVQMLVENTIAALKTADVNTRLQEKKIELQQENERLDQFASIVSHDLRSPLQVAIGNTEFLMDEMDSDELDRILRSLNRIDDIISSTLMMVREDNAVGAQETLQLDSVAKKAWEQVPTQDATLTIAGSRQVTANQNKLRQIFENLFRNTVEHCGSDVTVTVGTTDSGFYVADDGPGIPDDLRDSVFELGVSSSDGGTGFGLGIVKELATAHDWDVTLPEGAEDTIFIFKI